eukprot:TRINITY_DN25255_c0_g2_i2.p1 TRINITY_DN25255_c0_g2~~TRINITY_DN25255_c0_g2_i2.p1  ORF type:complete len:286 (+),score=67.45 TRINITY_DN25255_c0_g2_i2:123-980(+)
MLTADDERRRQQQEEVARVLAEQVAEKKRQKELAERQRKEEEDRENARLLHDQDDYFLGVRINRRTDSAPVRSKAEGHVEPERLERIQEANEEAVAEQTPAEQTATGLVLPGGERATQNRENLRSHHGAPRFSNAQFGRPQYADSAYRAAGIENDILRSFMNQQQEMQKQQSDALLQMQQDIERLRQEKAAVKEDMLAFKTKQVEEAEIEVKKLQKQLQRQKRSKSSQSAGVATPSQQGGSFAGASTPLQDVAVRSTGDDQQPSSQRALKQPSKVVSTPTTTTTV